MNNQHIWVVEYLNDSNDWYFYEAFTTRAEARRRKKYLEEHSSSLYLCRVVKYIPEPKQEKPTTQSPHLSLPDLYPAMQV